jgi:hypothetical protein
MSKETAKAAADSSAKDSKAEAPALDPVMKPADHARALGQTKKQKRFMVLAGEKKSYEALSAAHEAAAVLHGWAEHEHHTGKTIELSRSAYQGALNAASHFAEGTGDYVPHPAALSPFKGKGR